MPNFKISKMPINMRGQTILVVQKDDKPTNPAYVQVQVPEDFADYVIELQRNNKSMASFIGESACEEIIKKLF